MQQLAFLVNITLKQVFHKDDIKKEQVKALEKNRHWNRGFFYVILRPGNFW